MPSTDEFRSPPTFAFANIATHGPPWVPSVSRRPHFRHAFTRSHYALGPLAYPAIRWSSRATCRPSTSATEMIHEHTNVGASYAVWIVRTSPATGFPNAKPSPHRRMTRSPLRGRVSRVVSGQGSRSPCGLT